MCYQLLIMKQISFRTDILPLKDGLYRLALRLTMNKEEAEDIVQETLLKVWKRRERWQEIENIEGFAMTQMSGIGWYGDLGNFLVMPTTGPLKKISGKEDGSLDGWRSFYDKATETASPGYYSVDLTDYGIKAELTATLRTGVHRYTFPKGLRRHAGGRFPRPGLPRRSRGQALRIP